MKQRTRTETHHSPASNLHFDSHLCWLGYLFECFFHEAAGMAFSGHPLTFEPVFLLPSLAKNHSASHRLSLSLQPPPDGSDAFAAAEKPEPSLIFLALWIAYPCPHQLPNLQSIWMLIVISFSRFHSKVLSDVFRGHCLISPLFIGCELGKAPSHR